MRLFIGVLVLLTVGFAFPADAAEVTFRFAPPAGAIPVSVAGSFNDWNTKANPLADPDDDGVWEVTVELAPGKHQYKFVINGGQWLTDESAADFADDGFGGKNSVLTVRSEPLTVVGLNAATEGAAASASGDTPVRFRFRPAEGANTVTVAGSFNDWNNVATPMADSDGDGVWEITLRIPQGTHEYKFVVNGTEWITDQNAAEFTDDGFGGQNSVMHVGAETMVVGEPGGAAPGTAGSGTEVTFRYRPGVEGANAASVVGSFNEWNAAANPMSDDDGDGVWEITLRLAPGDYAYQYVVNGDRWALTSLPPDTRTTGSVAGTRCSRWIRSPLSRVRARIEGDSFHMLLRTRLPIIYALIAASVLLMSCGKPTDTAALDAIAESYVKLVLAMEQHDPGYVDAYHGPAEWRSEVEAEAHSLEDLEAEAGSVLDQLASLHLPDEDPLVPLRQEFLATQLRALIARIDLLQGTQMTFDEESAALYDAVAPKHAVEYFQDTRDELDRLLPGPGPLPTRVQDFRSEFEIPPDRLDTVFTAAIEECRRRTARHIDLPEGESFRVGYVTDKPWGGYNWYQGDLHSLIEVNTDLPTRIDRAVDLAGHEGYPGHHLYNVLIEKNLVQDRGWIEYAVYPLYAPQSLIAEGTANYGVEILFTPEERLKFEREVLFPLAGLDPDRAEQYYAVDKLLSNLAYAGNEAARGYLDGDMTREETVDWLVRYTLTSRERAARRIRFFDTYRSYVINYNLGEDIVRDHVESKAGAGANERRRWEVFEELLSSPTLLSNQR
jgi:hypothetical protein